MMNISDVRRDSMDILFKNDDFVFSYRVGGILIHKGKILLPVSYTHLTLPTNSLV